MSTQYFYVITLRDASIPGIARTVTASGLWAMEAGTKRDAAYKVIKDLQCRQFGLAESSAVLFFSLEKNHL